MNPYSLKILQEATELRKKIDNLHIFLYEGEATNILDTEEINLMQDQLVSMIAYYHVLVRRLQYIANQEVIDWHNKQQNTNLN